MFIRWSGADGEDASGAYPLSRIVLLALAIPPRLELAFKPGLIDAAAVEPGTAGRKGGRKRGPTVVRMRLLVDLHQCSLIFICSNELNS